MVSFKLTDQEKYEKLAGNIDALRRDSLVIGPNQQRIFTIDLSKCEYVRGKKRVARIPVETLPNSTGKGFF
jgi:hypothetical protein